MSKRETTSTFRGDPFEGIDGSKPTPENHATKATTTLRASLADWRARAGDGDAEIVATFEVHGEAAGGPSTLTAGLYLAGKLQLVSRTVMELATNTSDTRAVTLSATYRASSGETLAPVVRITRTRYGISAGNIVDVLSKVSSRVTLIKR